MPQFGPQSSLAAAELPAAVVVELRAWTARPLGAVDRRAPPVVLVPEPVDQLFGYADPAPDAVRLVVGVVDRRGEALLGQPHHRVEALQRVRDGALLEVVADAEVAQHLEHRDVSRVAHLFDVDDPERLLRRREPPVRRLRLAAEVRLELHHPGVGQQQRRIADWDQRRAGDPQVALGLEEAQERLAYFVAGGGRHRASSRFSGVQRLWATGPRAIKCSEAFREVATRTKRRNPFDLRQSDLSDAVVLDLALNDPRRDAELLRQIVDLSGVYDRARDSLPQA